MSSTRSVEPEGWYDDPDFPEAVRYWTGSDWAEARAYRVHAVRPSPARDLPRLEIGVYLAVGVGAIALAGIFFALGMTDNGNGWLAAGAIMGAVACAPLAIGAVALGVQLGLREHLYDFE